MNLDLHIPVRDLDAAAETLLGLVTDAERLRDDQPADDETDSALFSGFWSDAEDLANSLRQLAADLIDAARTVESAASCAETRADELETEEN